MFVVFLFYSLEKMAEGGRHRRYSCSVTYNTTCRRKYPGKQVKTTTNDINRQTQRLVYGMFMVRSAKGLHVASTVVSSPRFRMKSKRAKKGVPR